MKIRRAKKSDLNQYVNLGRYGFILIKKEANNKKTKRVYLRKSAADALLKAKNYLGEGYNFKIAEGKRAKSEQRAIIKDCERDFKRKKYQDWKKMLIKYTGGYDILKKKRFAPDTHLGGGAVDLTIMKGKKELSMGGIKLNEKSHLNYFEKKKKLTKKEKEIRDNRRLLKKVMKKARFKPSLHEWWHWGYKK
ncbi:MAG: M15 family metallopeptidase [Nanoarchaeota archaeon]